MALDKRSQVSLTFGTYIKLLSHRVKRFLKVLLLWLKQSQKINISRLFPYKYIRNQIRPCHKVGQAKFIICANLVETTSPMLHTKSQCHWPFVPENKIFKGFLTYMGVVALTLKLIYSHCLIRFHISSENKDFGFNSIQKINFSKNFTLKCNRKQI